MKFLGHQGLIEVLHPLHPGDIHSGGRGLLAVVRPYARTTAGIPLRMSFDIRRRVFEFEFCHDPAITAPTEFFIPTYQYPRGYCVDVSDGRYEMDPESQSLRYFHTLKKIRHRVEVRCQKSNKNGLTPFRGESIHSCTNKRLLVHVSDFCLHRWQVLSGLLLRYSHLKK
jgi:hypothetical protein